MSWAKFDDQYPDHPKIVEVGPLGMALHMAATCYCARYLTDGFVPTRMMARLVSFDGITIDSNGVSNQVTTKYVISELVRVGLFEIVEGGYFVHDYGEYNPSSDQVKAQRAENAEKQRKWREEHRNDNGQFESNQASNQVSNPLRNTVPSPSPSPLINTTTGSETQNVFTVYSREIGPITPTISGEIIEAEKDYPEEWIIAALQESARQNKRNWRYALAILKRWKVDGFQSVNKQPPKSNGSKSSKPVDTSLDDLIRSGR